MRRGPLYMTLAALIFTIMVVAVKIARESMGAVEVTAWRSLVAVPLVYVIGRRQLQTVERKGLLLVRCVLGFCAVYCFVTAARDLSVADLSLLHKLQPIWVAILAPWFLGSSERAGSGVWIALGVGLVGCALILSPNLDGVAPDLVEPGLWAVAGALFSALAHINLRALGRTEDSRAVVFWFQLSLLPLSVLVFFAEGGSYHGMPSLNLLPALVTVGVTAVVGQLLLTQAYKLDRAAPTAAASYTGPLWAYLLDYLLFDRMPTGSGLLGGALVVGAGIYLVASAPRRAEVAV
jgi:drug/metabolite transporter (DMT)-like permease